GMGQSFESANKKKSAGNFNGQITFSDSTTGFTYRPFWLNDTLYLEETKVLRDSTYKRVERIDYIIGSGHHTNSHIINRNGYLYQAPFTFYTQEGKLYLPPGFEKGYNTHFTRALGMECISCHNAYPEHLTGSLNKYKFIPEGIDCERCHGPGELHVKEKMAGKMVDIVNDTDFSIVNPKKLSYQYQIDVCQRCHLQGNALLKPNKTWNDFKPGMRLNEVMDVFMPVFKNETGPFVMAAHPDRLAKSKCFIESQNDDRVESMTCITCHNPHQSVRKTKQSYFNAKCANCHQGAKLKLCSYQNTNENCVNCHMKSSSTADIPHVSVTDHFIRVYDENENKQHNHNSENSIIGLQCLTQVSPSNTLKISAYLNYLEKFNYQPAIKDSLEKLVTAESNQLTTDQLIHYYFLNGWYSKITKLSKRFSIKSSNYNCHYHIAFAYERENNLDSAIKRLKRVLELQPLMHDYAIELSEVYLKQGNTKAAFKQLNLVLNEQPWNTKALNAKAFAHLLRFELTRAEIDLENALSLSQKALSNDPENTKAILTKAKVSLAKNDLATAEKELLYLLHLDPKNRNAEVILEQLKQVKE
ncbi:MAG: hypothetical protein KDC92_10935, partial [Bacteroidetes bacterium]|nr:hypothetical protein [Bacteroidota bacterium]